MSVDQIQQSLKALREEIATLREDDTGKRDRLDALVHELEQEVGNAGHPEHHESVVEKVQAAIETFEVEHPRATGILNDIMVVLGNMGI